MAPLCDTILLPLCPNRNDEFNPAAGIFPLVPKLAGIQHVFGSKAGLAVGIFSNLYTKRKHLLT